MAEPYGFAYVEPQKKKKKNHTPLNPIMHDGIIGFILISDDSHEIIMTRVSG